MDVSDPSRQRNTCGGGLLESVPGSERPEIKRIAFLSCEFVTEESFDGGLANYLDRVTRCLANRGHQVEVFVLSKASREETLRHGSILVHRVPEIREPARTVFRLLRHFGHLPLPRSTYVLSSAYELERSLRRRMAEVNFDVVQAPNYLASGLFVGLRGELPLVTRVSSYGAWGREGGAGAEDIDLKLSLWIESVALQKSDACYAPSRFLADRVTERERVHIAIVRPPFVPSEEQEDLSIAEEVASDSPYQLFFGTICERKGACELMSVVPCLIKEIPEYRFVMAGKISGGVGEELVKLQGDWPRNIRYLGSLKPSRLNPLIRGARGVILPSREDNFPNTCLESMSLGQIVVGTSGSSLDEILTDGETGFLVPVGDTSALLGAMRRVWNLSAAEMDRMGLAARGQMASLKPDVTIPVLETLFQRAIEAFRRSKRLATAN